MGRILTSQPIHPIGINPESPFAIDLEVAWTASAPGINFAYGAKQPSASVVGDILVGRDEFGQYIISQNGSILSFAVGSNNHWFSHLSAGRQFSTYTSNTRYGFSRMRAGAGDRIWDMGHSVTYNVSTQFGSFMSYYGGSGTSQLYTTLPYDKAHVTAGSYDGTTHRAAVDGVSLGSGPFTNTYNESNSFYYINNAITEGVYVALSWRRPLTQDQLVAITANPWQVFLDARRPLFVT